MTTDDIKEILLQVREVYVDLAARPVLRDCQLRTECCHFRLTGLTPQLTPGEALLAAKAMRSAGNKSLPEKSDGSCPFLDPSSTKCRIYHDRPFGCRTHFCEAAGGPYTRKEVIDLIRRLEDIGQVMGLGSEPRPLPDAVRRALDLLDSRRSRPIRA